MNYTRKKQIKTILNNFLNKNVYKFRYKTVKKEF